MSAQKVFHAEAFNKLCGALNKVYNAQRSDWGMNIPAVLWDYRAMCKKLMEQVPPRPEYGANVVIPIEYKMTSLRIAALTGMMDRKSLEKRLT